MRVCYPGLRREELVSRLRRCAEEISRRIPLKLMILFGSYASGRYTAASDVDLLVVYRGAGRDDVYGVCWDLIGLPNLELHAYSEEEYEGLRRSGSSLAREAEEKGIIIWRSE